jgi:hypothetical protein
MQQLRRNLSTSTAAEKAAELSQARANQLMDWPGDRSPAP